MRSGTCARRASIACVWTSSAAPDAQVVVLSSSPEAGWLADALRAKASAVLPGQMDPETLGLVLREVLAERDDAEVHELRPRLVRSGTPAGAAA